MIMNEEQWLSFEKRGMLERGMLEPGMLERGMLEQGMLERGMLDFRLNLLWQGGMIPGSVGSSYTKTFKEMPARSGLPGKCS